MPKLPTINEMARTVVSAPSVKTPALNAAVQSISGSSAKTYQPWNENLAINTWNSITRNGGSDRQALNALRNQFGRIQEVEHFNIGNNTYYTKGSTPSASKLYSGNGNSNFLKKNEDTMPDYSDYLASLGLGGKGGLSRIGGFKPSEAYNQAMAYTNQLLGQLNSGQTSYSGKINDLMGKIENRPKFSYDFNTDPLFQNALASAMQSGQAAMQDTMGQASALTGGYGSSYATSAANQAYNAMIQDAYSDLPQYYNMALNQYEMEGNELYNQLGMYRDADNTEYSRLYNAYNANLANAQDIYGKEYNNYWDTANYNLSVDKYNADQAMDYAKLMQSYFGKDGSGSGAGSDGETTYKNFLKEANSDKTLNLLINQFMHGGDKEGSAYDQHLSYLTSQGYDPRQIDDYVKDQTNYTNYKNFKNSLKTRSTK